MKKMLVMLLILAAAGNLCAQKTPGTVKGVLKDSTSFLPDATVSVMRASDSTLISFTITSGSGAFEIRNLETGDYLLSASFTGLAPRKQKFSITEQAPTVDLGAVVLDRKYSALDEVVIVDDAPIKIKGDTIDYKADAFKTKPDATVEDLLKKLPGVTVDRDGVVKAQGEEVKKVYVDGKEFFSNDPKLATKNLTAEMVDRVEVYDDMSEQAKFNGIDDGSRSKAINLKLKKDKKKGLFGKAWAGAASQQRWDAGLNANIFKGATQISVMARTNNTNNVGFSFSDMIGMFSGGGFGGGMGAIRTVSGNQLGNFGGINLSSGGGGITKSSNLGFNYRDTWSKHFDANGSYSFNHVNTDNDRKSLRRTFSGDSVLVRDDHAVAKAENDNHRFNMRINWDIDSFNSIIFNPNINYQKSFNTHTLDTFSTYIERAGKRYLSNESRSYTESEGDGYNISNDLIWRRKFRKRGRTLSVSLNATTGSSDKFNWNSLDAKYYSTSGLKYKDSTARTRTMNETDNQSKNVQFSYTEPLAIDKVIEFNGGRTESQNTANRQTANYNGASQEYDIIIPRLSNDFTSSNTYDKIGTNFRMVRKKYNWQVGFTYQHASLENENRTKGTYIQRSFDNFLPTANFNYQFARSRSLRINYRGTTRMPSVTQLQDVEDVSNPFYISRGNPNLIQEFHNNISLSYNFFDVVKFRNMFVVLNYNNTRNKISNMVEQLQGGLVQRSTPVNIDGGIYSLTGNINLGVPIKHLSGGNFNTNTRFNYNHDVNLINAARNITRTLTMGEELRLSYNWKEKLDLGVSAGVDYYTAKYQIQEGLNTRYFTHNYSLDATYVLPKNFVLASDFNYTFNTGRTDGYNQSFALLNGSLAKKVFKSKKGEVKFTVHDILNQNTSVYRTTTLNYIEDVQSSVLRRFYMVTFTYNLNRMGGRMMPAFLERATRNIRVTP